MGDHVRIMSANLWNGRADPQAFADLVLALAVDVVCVQELSSDQAEALAGVMPHGELTPHHAHLGMGIAMNRPGELFRVPMRSRDARGVWLHPGAWPQLQQPLQILNVHIMAPHVVFHRPSPLVVRPQQVRHLEAHLQRKEHDQIVVVGDFNSTPIWPAYRRIASQLTDAAVLAAQRTKRAPGRTWGPWHGSPRLLRLDHGFVRGVEVEQFQVVDIPMSDHSAVVMDISLRH